MSSHTVVIEIPEDCDAEQAGDTVEIEVPENQYVLDAAYDAGIDLPSSCRQGWCTTCACELVEGEIDQSNSRRYYDVDREAGFSLICTAKACSDLQIRACQYDEILDHRAEHDLPPGNARR